MDVKPNTNADAAIKLYTRAALALGTGQAVGAWQCVLRCQDGWLHKPETTWHVCAAPAIADARPLAQLIDSHCQWLREAVFPRIQRPSFFGTATISIWSDAQRRRIRPVVDIRETLRGPA